MSPSEQRECSHTSGLGHVFYFAQLNMDRSNTVPVPRQGLERHCIFPLLPLALLPFPMKEYAPDSCYPFSLGPKMRDIQNRPESNPQCGLKLSEF